MFETTGTRLQDARLNLGLSVKQACNRIEGGFREGEMLDLEAGVKAPDYEQIMRLATFYQVNPAYLVMIADTKDVESAGIPMNSVLSSS